MFPLPVEAEHHVVFLADSQLELGVNISGVGIGKLCHGERVSVLGFQAFTVVGQLAVAIGIEIDHVMELGASGRFVENCTDKSSGDSCPRRRVRRAVGH